MNAVTIVWVLMFHTNAVRGYEHVYRPIKTFQTAEACWAFKRKMDAKMEYTPAQFSCVDMEKQ